MQPILFVPPPSPHLVPFDGSFRVAPVSTAPPDDAPGKKANLQALEAATARIAAAQAKLYADDRYAVLVVLQALDAAGKDGALRAVFSGVNPAGCDVTAFKAPTSEELEHDYLWRCVRNLPERGRIGVWNRSHYEEVLVVRANPGYLRGQRLPRGLDDPAQLWEERYDSIRDHERHWARNGTVVLKFWFHVGQAEQRDRLLARIDEPESNWKFNPEDLVQRAKWGEYMTAYEDALNATSRPWAPWYAVPADSKSYLRRVVAEVVAETLEQLPLRWPQLSAEQTADLQRYRGVLSAE